MKVWLSGQLVDQADARVSVFDHGLLYGDGVFEGIRVYGGRIFKCRAHLDRLFASGERIRLEIPYSKAQLEAAMREAIEANHVRDGYIRLVVTRGRGTLGLDPFKCADPATFVIADDIALYPQEMYENGMAVIVAKTVRVSPGMLDPAVKSLNYLNNIYAKIEAIESGVVEAIMLNADGEVAECTGDNLFIVSDSQAFTPPPEAGLLRGITRGVVIDLAAEAGIALSEKPIWVEQLLAADECFLTGTAAEVVGVTRVNDRPIGDGNVGPVTRRLTKVFREYIRSGEWD